MLASRVARQPAWSASQARQDRHKVRTHLHQDAAALHLLACNPHHQLYSAPLALHLLAYISALSPHLCGLYCTRTCVKMFSSPPSLLSGHALSYCTQDAELLGKEGWSDPRGLHTGLGKILGKETWFDPRMLRTGCVCTRAYQLFTVLHAALLPLPQVTGEGVRGVALPPWEAQRCSVPEAH